MTAIAAAHAALAARPVADAVPVARCMDMRKQDEQKPPADAGPVERVVRPLVALVRSLELDHGPGGWPAVEMATLSALADAIDRHADDLRCALEALDWCIEDSAELLSERAAQWGEHRQDRQAAMAATLERHRALAERLRRVLSAA